MKKYEIEPNDRKFFANRTAILNDDKKIIVIEHYIDDVNDRVKIENSAIGGLNEYDNLKEQNTKLKRLLEDLTPGGSEFYDNPEYCAKWVKDHLQYLKNLYANLKKTTKS